MSSDPMFGNDAPPIVGLVAIVVAIAVVVLVVPRTDTRWAFVTVQAPLLGLGMIWFPHVFALFATRDWEPSQGLVRVVGWLLIFFPLLGLL